MTAEECLTFLDAFYQMTPRKRRDLPKLSFDVTVLEWYGNHQYDDDKGFMCSFFGCDPPRKALRSAMRPMCKRTLRDVCHLFSQYATVPVLPTHTYFGINCKKANAFTMIRNLLENEGVNVSNLSPRSPLIDYTNGSASLAYLKIIRLVPRLIGNIFPRFKDLLVFSDLCEVVAEYPTLAPSSSAP